MMSTASTIMSCAIFRRSIAMTIVRIALCYVLLFGMRDFANAFTNGPEDKYFCGWKWDDADCQSRQHCPTGRSEECDGFDEGVKCFANSQCDAKLGHGAGFVPGEPPKQSPGGTSRPTFTGKSDNITDHYWCGVGLDDAINKCGVHCPSGTSNECPQGHICYHDVLACDARNIVHPAPPSISPKNALPTLTPGTTLSPATTSSPTMIPTDEPIGPPDPLTYPSDDPTDHWFCGVSLDDTNAKCEQHCPTATECPMGQICFFGTQCDSRTYSPTPPPTHRPTTSDPTQSPTFTMLPTLPATVSMPPSAAPTLPGPSKSPTLTPTPGPTYAPMPSTVATFFCGIDWDDAVTNCKRRCPSGESTECPFDEKCFTLTPCKEEMGYPEEFGLSNGTNAAAGGGTEACVPFTVTIVADNWPKEISWVVKNIDMNETVAEGDNENLIPGKPVEYNECLKSKMGCYEFTINDTGGDGICCKDGSGSYKITWDGEMLMEGAAFYESETTPFGGCGVSEQPTASPLEAAEGDTSSGVTISSGVDGDSGDLAYRCVAKALLEQGYQVSSDKCELFINCFNPQINVADDWFCDESEQCVSVSACSINGDEASDKDTAMEQPASRPVVTQETPTETTSVSPTGATEVLLHPTMSPAPGTLEETVLPTTSSEPGTSYETILPTTSHTTYGPCGGLPCYQNDHCRSQYGFCGPGEGYCDDSSIWTKDCPDVELSSHPSPSLTTIPITNAPELDHLPFSKPQGGKKPVGGKGEPARTNPPINQSITTGSPTAINTAFTSAGSVSTGSPTAINTAFASAGSVSTGSPTAINTAFTSAGSPTSSPILSEEASDDFWSSTYSITTPPSSSSETHTEDESLIADSVLEANDESCTGEPCPVSTHCRSRYGSCGPGFIYCNMYTIWKDTCPPSPLGAKFTQTPAHNSVTPTDSPALNPDFSLPTMPPLARPSLPTITKASPFNITNSVSATDKETPSNITSYFFGTDEGNAESETANMTDEDSNIDKENQQENSEVQNDSTNVFQSEVYLTEWIQSASNGVKPCYLESGLAVTTLMLLIL
ncbi:hypothetical protein ACHAW5_011022 [Stephanodiscus triporus]|uniref:Chitin-binding type-1 domain-containing protein n=1 Tax=Stephanodiscus triporus TaxID=2934178 RepID=A0ABD3NLS9_9STRA